MIVKNKTLEQITSSKDVEKIFKNLYALLSEEDKHKEVFYVAGLDAQNRIQYIDLVTLGTINSASPVIREVVRQAIIKNSVSIIACHNHPSGDNQPSKEDNFFTKKLKEACVVLSITLLDHIILADSYYSYSDNGCI